MKLVQKIFLGCLLFCLTACPIPAYYTFLDEKNPDKGEFKFYEGSYELNLLHAHPWFDSRKKAIIMKASLYNSSNSHESIFHFSNVVLRSRQDSFSINFTNRNLKNDFIVEKDTIVLSPKSRREVDIYFISLNDYTKKSYNISIEADTLTFSLSGENEMIYLIGKRNRR